MEDRMWERQKLNGHSHDSAADWAADAEWERKALGNRSPVRIGICLRCGHEYEIGGLGLYADVCKPCERHHSIEKSYEEKHHGQRRRTS